MGVANRHSSIAMATYTTLVILWLPFCINRSSGLFFGTPNSECRSDSQCPSFGRTRCLGTNFILCFGQTQSYTVSGRCLNRSNIICGLGNLLGGRRSSRNCRYRQCAECLIDRDCRGYNQQCSLNNYCTTRSPPPGVSSSTTGQVVFLTTERICVL